MIDWIKLRKRQNQDFCTKKKITHSRVEKLVCVEILFYFSFIVQMKMTCVLMNETITSWCICQCQRWWISHFSSLVVEYTAHMHDEVIPLPLFASPRHTICQCGKHYETTWTQSIRWASECVSFRRCLVPFLRVYSNMSCHSFWW